MLRNRVFLIATLACSIGWGQRLHYGAVAGFTANDTYYKTMDESKPYVLGGFGEVRVWRELLMTADVLYRRQGADTSKADWLIPPPAGANVDNIWLSHSRLNVWDFPILVKAYVTPDERPIRLFVDGGYVLRSVHKHSVRTNAYSQNPVSVDVEEKGIFHGAAIGGGISLKVTNWLAIEPQYRFTRFSELPLAARDVHDVLVAFRF